VERRVAAFVSAEQVELDDHGVVGVTDRVDLVAPVGERMCSRTTALRRSRSAGIVAGLFGIACSPYLAGTI